MKITPANADPDGVPHGLKEVQVRPTKWGWVVQKRPGPHRKPFTLEQKQYQARFGIAGRLASDPNPFDFIEAVAWSKGTQQVPRDLLTRAALGRFWQIVNPDGTVWGHVEGPVYKPDTNTGTPPEPGPQPVQEDEMQWTRWHDPWTAPNSTTAYAFKGGTFTPRRNATVTLARAILNVTKDQTYRFVIGTHDATGKILTLNRSTDLVAARTAHACMEFPMQAELANDVQHFAMVGCISQGNTHALSIWFSGPQLWLWQCTPGSAALLAQAAPATGQTLYLPVSDATPPLAIDIR